MHSKQYFGEFKTRTLSIYISVNENYMVAQKIHFSLLSERLK